MVETELAVPMPGARLWSPEHPDLYTASVSLLQDGAERLAFIVDKHNRNESEVYVLEAEHPERGPVARLKIPLRLRVGVHGNWVPAERLPRV